MWTVLNQAGETNSGTISPAVFINNGPGFIEIPGSISFFSFDNPNARKLHSQVRSQWNTNSWYHVLVSGDSLRNRNLYVNGILENTAIDVPFGHASPNFYIGANTAHDLAHFFGDIDDVRVYDRALAPEEVTSLFQINTATIIDEPPATRIRNWLAYSLASGFLRDRNASLFYVFVDDRNTNSVVDRGDDFVTSEYVFDGPSIRLVTLARTSIPSLTAAQGYGLAVAKFLSQTNELLFTGEPDGQVFAWTASGATNPLQKQSFSAHYLGNAWHALAGVETLDGSEGLLGLLVNPSAPNICDLIYWRPEAHLPVIPLAPQTAPIARVLPNPSTGAAPARVEVRFWDAEGNDCLPLMEYRGSGETNWHPATILQVGSEPYSVGSKVAALPKGTNHQVWWDTRADLGSEGATNVFLRVRARDVTLLGDWSEGMPFRVEFAFTQDSDGDGLQDQWEVWHFGDLTRNGNDDLDGDAFIDRFEYLAGTDPRDANSVLRITLVQRVSDSEAHVQWQSGTNVTLYLQRRFGLSAQSWQDIFTNSPPVSLTNYFDNSATNDVILYRVKTTQ
jgi:hypothetical protein